MMCNQIFNKDEMNKFMSHHNEKNQNIDDIIANNSITFSSDICSFL